jgi:hypothetical protein
LEIKEEIDVLSKNSGDSVTLVIVFQDPLGEEGAWSQGSLRSRRQPPGKDRRDLDAGDDGPEAEPMRSGWQGEDMQVQAPAPPWRGEVTCRCVGMNGTAKGHPVLLEDGPEQSRYRSMVPVVGLRTVRRVHASLLAVSKALP